MFICRACVRRLASTSIEARLLVHPLRPCVALGSIQRAISTTSTTPTQQDSPQQITAIADAPHAPHAEDKTDPVDAAHGKKLEWVVNKHLRYLNNNFKIAEHVLKTLERGAFDEALLLTRKASRDHKVTVSWNHLIDYLLKGQRLNAAIKLYNEMKKRAQLPDSKTYTIIFRGCAGSEHPKLALAEATRIYNSMLAHERLKPNTIHLNAVLECCNRAGDLDTLWTILATINDGLRAPNKQTYTIIFNALRNRPDQRAGLDEEATNHNLRINIEKAKVIWKDAVKRWRNGQILIDEELVCSMGRMLASGNIKDRQAVFALLRQTMKLPRLDRMDWASISGEAGKTGQEEAGNAQHEAEEEYEEEAQQEDTAPKQVAKSLQYAVPGPNTLSLIMMCVQKTDKPSLAQKYWRYLTTVCGVTPDKDNYLKYLKVLNSTRGSTHAADAIVAMPKEFLNAFALRTAMSTCIHDELNRHALENACRIFDAMVRKTLYPDPLTMRLFLQVARGSIRHLYEKHDKDEVAAKKAVGKQIVTAVDRMWEPFRILMSSFSFSNQSTRSPEHMWNLTRGEVQEAMATARRMIAAMDKVTFEDMADPNVCRTLRNRRVVLNNLVERYILKEHNSVDDIDKPRLSHEQRLRNELGECLQK